MTLHFRAQKKEKKKGKKRKKKESKYRSTYLPVFYLLYSSAPGAVPQGPDIQTLQR